MKEFLVLGPGNRYYFVFKALQVDYKEQLEVKLTSLMPFFSS